MRRTILSTVTVLIVLLAGIAPVHAQIVLRFSPPDTTIAPDGDGQLSIMLDEAIDVRTIDIRISFDPTVIQSLGGTGGQLFTQAGFQLFQGFEESAPGEWYGFTVVIGADDYVFGPGELFTWDFEALAEGVSAITDVQTYMAAGDGTWYSETIIDGTTITVADPLSPVTDLPALRTGLNVWPNPFNPRTEVGFELDRSGWVYLAVFDIKGRRVAVLHDGSTPSGPFSCTWNGKDTSGTTQPGGVYLFRMTTPTGNSVTKGLLLK